MDPPLPHLHRDWAHPCHICAGTGPTPATSATRRLIPPTSASGLGSPPFHIYARTGLTPPACDGPHGARTSLLARTLCVAVHTVRPIRLRSCSIFSNLIDMSRNVPATTSASRSRWAVLCYVVLQLVVLRCGMLCCVAAGYAAVQRAAAERAFHEFDLKLPQLQPHLCRIPHGIASCMA